MNPSAGKPGLTHVTHSHSHSHRDPHHALVAPPRVVSLARRGAVRVDGRAAAPVLFVLQVGAAPQSAALRGVGG